MDTLLALPAAATPTASPSHARRPSSPPKLRLLPCGSDFLLTLTPVSWLTSLRCNRSAPIQQSDSRVTTSLASEAEVAPRVTIPHNARLQPSSETGYTVTVLASIFRPPPQTLQNSRHLAAPFWLWRRAGQLRLNVPSINLRSGPSASPPNPPACLSSSAQQRPQLCTVQRNPHHLIIII